MSTFLNLIANGLAVGAVYGLVGLGFTLIYKVTKVFNFAVGQFMCIGAFLVWHLTVQFHLPLAVGMLLGIASMGLLGLLSEILLVRPMIGQSVLSIIIMTLGLDSFLKGFATLVWGISPASYPRYLPKGAFEVAGVGVGKDIVFFFFIAMVIGGAIAFYFEKGKRSIPARATAEDPQVAQAAGIRVTKISTLVWTFGGIVCGIGGLSLGTIRGVDMFLPEYGLKVIPAVLIGGLESIPGVIVGGLIIGVLEKLGTGYINPLVGGGIETVIAYMVMTVFLIFRPHGLFGLKKIERL